MKRWLLKVVVLLAAVVLTTPGTAATRIDEEKFVVVKAGRVITISGEEYAPGMIIIADGKVRLVGQNLEYPDGARVIDARRETVMPGMINPRTRFQLPGYNRSGVHTDLKAADEIVYSQIEFEEFLKAGYTAVTYIPGGGGVSGLAGVIRTAGPEAQRRLKDASYVRVDLTNPAADKKTLRDAFTKAQAEIDKVKKAREEWEKKQKEKAEAQKKQEAEQKKKESESPSPKPEDKPTPRPDEPSPPAPRPPRGEPETPTGDSGMRDVDRDETLAAPASEEKPKEPGKEDEKKDEDKFVPPPVDIRYQVFIDLIEGRRDVPLLLEVDQASDVVHAFDVMKPYKEVPWRLMLGHRPPQRQSDYDYAVKALGEAKARVILQPAILYLPYSVEQYNLAKDLDGAGCEIAFMPWWDAPLEYERVRSRVADLVRAGLNRKTALKALTMNAATVVGVADRVGSIEKDRDADLVFLTGDPLAPLTKVSRVMILGEMVYDAREDRK